MNPDQAAMSQLRMERDKKRETRDVRLSGAPQLPLKESACYTPPLQATEEEWNHTAGTFKRLINIPINPRAYRGNGWFPEFVLYNFIQNFIDPRENC